MKRFFRWLFSWRPARRALISGAVFATLVGLFHAEENWRGKHAWNEYRRELEARGEQLDFKAFIPKPVPDEQNFAATPFVKSWFVRSNYQFSNFWQDVYGQVSSNITTSLEKRDGGNRHFVDLVAWKMAFDVARSGTVSRSQVFESDKLDLASRAMVAPVVLEGLKTNEAVFAELRAASQRPNSRYPVQYNLEDPWGILLPHLSNVRNICKRLQFKACAELAVGQSTDALEDVKLTLYMADSVKDEPFIISYLVRIACVQIAVQPIWEGLAERAWSDAELQEVQTHLQQYDFVADLKPHLDAERAAGVLTPELARGNGPGPSGWYSLEQRNYCRLFQLEFRGTYDVTQRRVSPSQIESNKNELGREMPTGHPVNALRAIFHHQVFAAMLLPALPRLPVKAATAQTAVDQATLACALERCRLANGQFPETLEALVPRFISQLPHDVITGEPYKYRRTNDGQFVLYSVGWNEKDDGGVPGKTLFDEKKGDWVWQYPAR